MDVFLEFINDDFIQGATGTAIIFFILVKIDNTITKYKTRGKTRV